MAEAPKRAVKFAANEQYSQLLTGGQKPTVLQATMAGTLAGMTEATVNCPFEVVKVRMQAKENKGLYRSTMHAFSAITKNEGLLALYTGFESMLWRNGIWNGVYFGSINYVRGMLPAPKVRVCVDQCL